MNILAKEFQSMETTQHRTSDYIERAWRRISGEEPVRCCVFVNMQLPDQPIEHVTNSFLDHTGYPKNEVVGFNCRFLQGPDTDPAARAFMRKAIDNRQSVVVELLNYRKTGEPFWNRLSMCPVFDPSGVLTHYAGVQNPLTEIPAHPLMQITP